MKEIDGSMLPDELREVTIRSAREAVNDFKSGEEYSGVNILEHSGIILINEEGEENYDKLYKKVCRTIIKDLQSYMDEHNWSDKEREKQLDSIDFRQTKI